jgi:hypothetical protein
MARSAPNEAISSDCLIGFKLRAGQIDAACRASRNRPAININVGLPALQWAAADNAPQALSAGVGIARRTFPAGAAMARQLGRVDPSQPDTLRAASQGVAISDLGR